MSQNKFYVTTPIYYVTAKPHLGSLYSTLLADVLARWNTIQGKDSFFLTGTDEHGQKVAEAAQKAGKNPQEFVDSFIPAYKHAWDAYDIAYTNFIRTTDSYHVKAVQNWLRELKKTGDVYKSQYEGWYCTPCETFVTPKDGPELDANEGPLCTSCGRPTSAVAEETYFFKLSAYQDKLLKFYKDNPDFITPKERMNEVTSFVESGLKDLSISRTTVKWGIPFPNDDQHVAYVWADALNNYITGVGYGQSGKEKEFKKWWPADVHVLGKDIVRFHAVYWPAFLMASDLKLPKRLLVHGWIRVDKQKMSKSLGNVIDPLVLEKQYGADAVRYYLVRQIAITHDGEFSIQDLEKKIETDLANDLGNLLNRMVMLAEKNGVVDVAGRTVWSEAAIDLRDECFNMIEDFEGYMDDCLFHMALGRVWKFISQVNTYFHTQEPWKLAKGDDQDAFGQVLSATCHSLRAVAYLLWPVMPKKMEALLGSLGKSLDITTDTLENLELGAWRESFMLKKIDPLFTKPEPQIEPAKAQPVPEVPQNYIKIDDVAKVELIVGTIEQCESVEKSEKLLKMQVNLGDHGIRQVLSGIRKHYAPEDLIGKQGIFVANLKPRKMMGMESQGMMLLADDADGGLKMATVAGAVPNGARLK